MVGYLSLFFWIRFWGTKLYCILTNNGLEPYEVRQLSTKLESDCKIVFKIEINKTDEILKEQKL